MKSYVIYSVKCVITDAQPCTHVVQNLSFQLGQYHSGVIAEKKPMALVCKLSRGHYMPPPFTSVQDWFHYAFATSEIKGELEINIILCFKVISLNFFVRLAIPF